MAETMAAAVTGAPARNFSRGAPRGSALIFAALLVFGLGFGVEGLFRDLHAAREVLPVASILVLGGALLIALGFEFVNGFHDTANAVATVIYTNSMAPSFAAMWSGFFNFLGVLLSSGAVAYGIVSLLPVELILRVGSGAGYAMIFALLLSALLWNLFTWYLGIPNSSSHALIGSVLGVGVANQLLAPSAAQASGVDWGQAQKILNSLALSPVIGFLAAAALLFLAKQLLRNPALFREPEGDKPPPLGIRALLILTCTGVSFAHGSNDGQKGMGLIMLILIGVAPATFALNRTLAAEKVPAIVASAQSASMAYAAHASPDRRPTLAEARVAVNEAVRTSRPATPQALAAMSVLSADVGQRIQRFGSLGNAPAAETTALRDDLYVLGEANKKLGNAKDSPLVESEKAAAKDFGKSIDSATHYIPTWVKGVVAVALGLGTMIGWRRIVVTVGEKIGKQHLTYAQGASAELVAMGTILAADTYGLPVSTTHILSSGVAGTMWANGSGLQRRTLLSIAAAWITTLPATILLSGALYALLRAILA